MNILRFVFAAAAIALLLFLSPQASGHAVASGSDAQPQGVFPDERYTFTADPCSDMVDTFEGQPELYKGDCSGATWSTTSPATLFPLNDVYDQFLAAGDWNKDECEDLIGIKAGALTLIEGDCAGGVKAEIAMPGDFSAYNYFAAVGLFDGDFNPDLVARRTGDSSLWLLSGDGASGFTGTPTQIGTGWSVCDIILGAGDFNHDGNPDIMCRRTDDHMLHLYTGNGDGTLNGDPVVVGSSEVANYDWLMAGGDWYYSDNNHCPDIAAWTKSDPTHLTLYPGDCQGNINTTLPPMQIAPVGGGGFSFPFGGDSAKVFLWGDVDCNGAVNPVDALRILRVDAGLPQSQPLAICGQYGTVYTVNGMGVLWADTDCNGRVDAVDALRVLLADAGRPPAQTVEDCPAFVKGFSFNIG